MMMLLAMVAQVNKAPQGGGGGGGGGGAEVLGMCACYSVLIIASIIIHVLFLLNISKTLALCSPRNQTMTPGQVWLNLIPLFGTVWIFITFIRLSESLQNEYRSRGIRPEDPEFAKMTGILYMVLSLVGCGPVGLVFFIMYWVKVSGFRKTLENDRGGGTGLEDDYDDRPSRRDRDRIRDDDQDDDRPRRRDDRPRDDY